MKKVFTLIIIATLAFGAQAQVCTPDESIKSPGVYPDELPVAFVGKKYEQIIQFKFIKDTLFQGVRINLDSFIILEARKMPPGFTYKCNRQRCDYLPLAVGCVKIEGTPEAEHVGSDSVEIDVLAYYTVPFVGTVASQKVTDKLALTIAEPTSISEESIEQFAIYPNPATERLNLAFNAQKPARMKIRLIDALGKTVLNKEYQIQAGANRLDLPLTGYANGLALLNIQSSDGVSVSRKVRLLR